MHVKESTLHMYKWNARINHGCDCSLLRLLTGVAHPFTSTTTEAFIEDGGLTQMI